MRHLSNNEKTKYNTYSFSLVPYSSAMIDLGEEEPDYGAIDSIHYKGGPITKQEHVDYRREHYSDGHKLAIRKQKEGNDDSESDVSTGEREDQHAKSKRRKTAGISSVKPDFVDKTLPGKRGRPKRTTEKTVYIDCSASPNDITPKPEYNPRDECNWNGIDFNDILSTTYGESLSGRIRLCLSNMSKHHVTVFLKSLFSFKNEAGLLHEMTKNDNTIKLNFFYLSEGFLYDAVVGDGLCGPRSMIILQDGGIVADTDNRNKASNIVAARDINLKDSNSRRKLLEWLNDLHSQLMSDSIEFGKYLTTKDKLMTCISEMIAHVENEVPRLLHAHSNSSLFFSGNWMTNCSVRLISALKHFKVTCFEPCSDFDKSRPVRGKRNTLQWYRAVVVGDGVNANEDEIMSFSHRVLREDVVHEPVFLSLTGMEIIFIDIIIMR